MAYGQKSQDNYQNQPPQDNYLPGSQIVDAL